MSINSIDLIWLHVAMYTKFNGEKLQKVVCLTISREGCSFNDVRLNPNYLLRTVFLFIPKNTVPLWQTTCTEIMHQGISELELM